MSNQFYRDLHQRSLWRDSRLFVVLLFCVVLWPLGVAQAAPLAQAPAPENDSVTIEEDTATLIDVLANDTESNGSPLTLAAVGAPRTGTAEIVNNQIRYTPKPNFLGVTRSFTPFITAMSPKPGKRRWKY